VLYGGAHWRHLANTIELSMFGDPAETAEPIEMPFGLWTQVGPGKHVLGGWGCHLANTVEPSICGSDAALLSNYSNMNRIRHKSLPVTVRLNSIFAEPATLSATHVYQAVSVSRAVDNSR